jgi:Ca2+-binding RTX toxin-like protein
LFGEAGDDLLIGSAGLDHLSGGAGQDTLRGGAGDDTYYLTEDLDQIEELVGGGHDVVIWSKVGQTLDLGAMGAQVEDVQIQIPIEAVVGTFTVKGNGLANTVWGSDGMDDINGMGGDDTLAGGLGNDIYRYSANGGADTIYEQADIFDETDLGGQVIFGDVAWNQLWLKKVVDENDQPTDDLMISILGTTGQSVTVKDWTLGRGSQLASITGTTGALMNAQVDALVEAMGATGWAAALPSQTVLTQAQADVLRGFWGVSA